MQRGAVRTLKEDLARITTGRNGTTIAHYGAEVAAAARCINGPRLVRAARRRNHKVPVAVSDAILALAKVSGDMDPSIAVGRRGIGTRHRPGIIVRQGDQTTGHRRAIGTG